MANNNCTAKTTLTYVDPLGASLSSVLSATAPYSSSVSVSVDIPDATSAATSFPISFSSISDATALVISNTNNDEMEVTINSSATPITLPAGGVLIIAAPTVTGITSVSVETVNPQSGDGRLAAYVFGDPVVA